MIKAIALILVPILCGAAYFSVKAPVQAPGAYVEIADGVYPLATCEMESSATVASAAAPVIAGDVRALFLVLGADTAEVTRGAQATLGLRVIDYGESDGDLGWTALPTVVSRVARRVLRVSSPELLRWDANGISNRVYEAAMARHVGARATSEVLVELSVPAAHGSCRYAIVLGPPPGSAVSALNWFVPPAERRP